MLVSAQALMAPLAKACRSNDSVTLVSAVSHLGGMTSVLPTQQLGISD